MNEGTTEIFDRNSKIILGILIVLIATLLLVLNQMGYFENQRRDAVLNQHYKAVVVKKYIDKLNHNTPKLKLSNGRELIDYWPNKTVTIEVGDSIIKDKMSTNLGVIRNAKIIYSLTILTE
ncbi:MAG: hypothetical protein RL427_1302 [Bacteroidota bacterium]|jgi:hypothetical protein